MFIKKLKSLFIDLDKLEWDIRFAYRKCKHVILCHLTIIVLTKVKIICIRYIPIAAWMLLWQIKELSFSFQPLITKAIGKVPVPPPVFIKLTIGTQIKAYTESFP